MTNEVTWVQHSNKTPWAVKLYFQTSAPSKWDRQRKQFVNKLLQFMYNSYVALRVHALVCWTLYVKREYEYSHMIWDV